MDQEFTFRDRWSIAMGADYDDRSSVRAAQDLVDDERLERAGAVVLGSPVLTAAI